MTRATPASGIEVAYRFRPGFVGRWLFSQVLGRRRRLSYDAEHELAAITPAPRSEGEGHIPRSGPVILVMNHYERPGLRVWWPALVVSAAVWRVRQQEPPVCWMITDRFYRYRLGWLVAPGGLIPWLLRRVARAYGLIVVPRRLHESGARSHALLAAREQLRATDPRVVGLTPDAESGGRQPGQAWRNAGAAVAALSAGSVPVLPVAVFEDADGTLVARFGAPSPFGPSRDGGGGREQLAQELMARITSLLPSGRAPTGRPL